VVNGLNQYTNAGGANPGAGQQIDYDNNANLNSDGNFTYVYDDENRLVGATAAVQSIKLTYDPLGRLFESDINNPGGRKKIQYLYDGDALIAEFDALNNNTLLRRYVHGDQVDEPWLQFYKTNTVSVADRIYLHADQQGSIIALSNGSGAVTNALAYDNYGTLSWLGNFNFRFGYTGQIYFPEMNLWFYKNRLYSPALGRFLQTDKIGYLDNMNMYMAMGDDPINRADPSGLAATCPSFAQCYGPMYSGQADSQMRNPANWTPKVVDTYVAETSKDAAEATVDGAIAIASVVAPELIAAKIAVTAIRTTTAIGRVKDLKNLPLGQKSLLSRLPNKGSPQANWKQNSGVLRSEMKKSQPIRDASVGDNSGEFLNAERNLLQDRGWKLDDITNFWNPPS
jgi:RHS repeat-associated protein